MGFSRSAVGVTLAAVLCSSALHADTSRGITPEPRSESHEWMSLAQWKKYHAEDQLIAAHDAVDVLFVGDSITAGWDWPTWQQHFAPLNAANFAIGGDHTGNVLWRLQQGTIGQLHPKVVVLLIGVNNLGALQESPRDAADGVTRVVQQLQLAWPRSKILLQAVFPFDEKPDSPNRKKVKQLNTIIKKLDDNQQVFFRDYSDVMLEKDGTIAPATMEDFLHPTPAAYTRWAKRLAPDINSLLK